MMGVVVLLASTKTDIAGAMLFGGFVVAFFGTDQGMGEPVLLYGGFLLMVLGVVGIAGGF